MSRPVRRGAPIGAALAALAALAVLALGAVGARGYAQDYDLHRGFASVVPLPRAGAGRLLDVHFRSAALHRRADYMVYLPPGYTPARRYPVAYLLHGMPGQPRVFVTIANLDVRLDNLVTLGRAKPMILVFPDGRIGGSVFSDSEWADTPAGRYESYVLDVMHDVDARFATLARRTERVIGGFSAGGYGALNIALHHLADFGSVQAWSGYFTQTPTGVFAHAAPATLAYDSPLRYVLRAAPAIRARGLRVVMFAGRDDGSRAQLAPMAARLRAAGARVSDVVYPGGHDWSVWYPRLNAMLIQASQDMGHGSGRARLGAAVPLGGAAPAGSPAALPHPSARHHPLAPSRLALLAALLLALASGALINIGFIVQQRGLRQVGHAGTLLRALHNRTWLMGQLIGWVGFAGQIVAVALAPLTLVQAFAAGSLALSVPVAARTFGLRVTREQAAAIALVGVALVVLPIGFAPRHPHLSAGILIGGALAGAAVAGLAGWIPRGAARAVAAGIGYGIADAAIKAVATGVRHHGLAAVPSGWTVLAAAATFGGFVSFQSALRRTDAVSAVSLMNALTAVTALVMGLAAFGESLGTSPAAGALHLVAIATVLACVRPLARGGQEHAIGGVVGGGAGAPARGGGVTGSAIRIAAGIAAVLLAALASVAATGLLYQLRGLGWLGTGPTVPDSLPLLQLAGFAGQPVVRVAAAFIVTGAALGAALHRLRPVIRAPLVGLGSAVTLLLASDASFALARNLRLFPVLSARSPGLGPWLEAILLAGGAVLFDAGRRGIPPARRWLPAAVRRRWRERGRSVEVAA